MNKYLEKIANLHDAKYIGEAALDIARHHPLPVALGAGGGAEAAMENHRQGHEPHVQTALRGVKNVLRGTAEGAAAGTALEFGGRKFMAKVRQMKGERYISKVASMLQAPKRFAKGVEKAWEETPGPSRLSLGLSAAGLGIGTANYVSSQRRYERAAKQNEIEQKSLATLKGIHKAIVQQSE
jgi:hypothetical protein